MVLNEFYTNPEIYDLTKLGIEGVHWEAVGEDQYKLLDNAEDNIVVIRGTVTGDGQTKRSTEQNMWKILLCWMRPTQESLKVMRIKSNIIPWMRLYLTRRL